MNTESQPLTTDSKFSAIYHCLASMYVTSGWTQRLWTNNLPIRKMKSKILWSSIDNDKILASFSHPYLLWKAICNGHTVHAVSKCNLDRNMVFAKPIYIVQSKVTKWYDKRGQGYLLCNWVEYHGANLSGILCFARKFLFVCTLGSQALQFHYGYRYLWYKLSQNICIQMRNKGLWTELTRVI